MHKSCERLTQWPGVELVSFPGNTDVWSLVPSADLFSVKVEGQLQSHQKHSKAMLFSSMFPHKKSCNSRYPRLLRVQEVV